MCVYLLPRCVCASVLASSAALVMLRQTLSGWVYFWVSDSVSMAADASERKALRYKQTLVSVPLLLSICPSGWRLSVVCLQAALLWVTSVNLRDAPVFAL